jgi:hypothetical protein
MPFDHHGAAEIAFRRSLRIGASRLSRVQRMVLPGFVCVITRCGSFVVRHDPDSIETM